MYLEVKVCFLVIEVIVAALQRVVLHEAQLGQRKLVANQQWAAV